MVGADAVQVLDKVALRLAVGVLQGAQHLLRHPVVASSRQQLEPLAQALVEQRF
jgi:hypothetical protein